MSPQQMTVPFDLNAHAVSSPAVTDLKGPNTVDAVMVAVVVTVTVVVLVEIEVPVLVKVCDDVCVGEPVPVFELVTELVTVVVGPPAPVVVVESEPELVTVALGVPVCEAVCVEVLVTTYGSLPQAPSTSAERATASPGNEVVLVMSMLVPL